jgi:hypothetical protein
MFRNRYWIVSLWLGLCGCASSQPAGELELLEQELAAVEEPRANIEAWGRPFIVRRPGGGDYCEFDYFADVHDGSGLSRAHYRLVRVAKSDISCDEVRFGDLVIVPQPSAWDDLDAYRDIYAELVNANLIDFGWTEGQFIRAVQGSGSWRESLSSAISRGCLKPVLVRSPSRLQSAQFGTFGTLLLEGCAASGVQEYFRIYVRFSDEDLLTYSLEVVRFTAPTLRPMPRAGRLVRDFLGTQAE